jgi:hypothetical protein
MESRAIQAAERNRKVDEEFHKTDTSLLIGPFYVFRVGDKKRFDAIQLCTTTTTAISRDKVQHLLCRYNENERKKKQFNIYRPKNRNKIKKEGRLKS